MNFREMFSKKPFFHLEKMYINTSSLDSTIFPLNEIGRLIDLLVTCHQHKDYFESDYFPQIEQVITELVIRISSGEKCILDIQSLIKMNALLEVGSDECVIATLDSLAYIGIEENLPAILKLIVEYQNSNKSLDVLDNAKECHIKLRDRLHNPELLRSSEVPIQDLLMSTISPMFSGSEADLLRPCITGDKKQDQCGTDGQK